MIELKHWKKWTALLSVISGGGLLGYVFVYWMRHPALSQMQIFMEFWLLILLAYLCLLLAGALGWGTK